MSIPIIGGTARLIPHIPIHGGQTVLTGFMTATLGGRSGMIESTSHPMMIQRTAIVVKIKRRGGGRADMTDEQHAAEEFVQDLFKKQLDEERQRAVDGNN